MMSTLRVEPLALAHVEAVRVIDAQVYPDPWSAKLLADGIDDPARDHLVALEGDSPIGHGAMQYADLGDEVEATLATIAVDPTRQGSGVATRVLLALVDRAMERSTSAMTLEVRNSNRRAQRMYIRFGFAPVGTRPDYYRPDLGAVNGEREDAIIMWARDVDQPDYRDRLNRIRDAIATAPVSDRSAP